MDTITITKKEYKKLLEAEKKADILEKNRKNPATMLSAKERAAVWESARGMWKNKKPDPIKELKKARKEWDRKLPSLA